LPEAYGTQRVLAAPRDPRSLYVHCDLTDDQQQAYRAQAADSRLVVRVHQERITSQPAVEVPMPQEARHCFVHLPSAGLRYLAELGYYQPGLRWTTVAASAVVQMPREAVSEDRTVRFVHLAPSLSFAALPSTRASHPAPPWPASYLPALSPAASAPPESVASTEQGLVEAAAVPGESKPWETEAPPWSPAQEQALEDLLRQSLAGGGVAGVSSEAFVEASSPAPAPPPSPKDFWFTVNAELVIYGATERDATVTIAGQPIQLRPDGTFTFRLAFPEGTYDLPVRAVSAQGQSKGVELRFRRETVGAGDVGVTPPSEELPPPVPESFS
jgi:hypothetical protein